MFENRYKNCMLTIKGYETYYHDGDGYSYSTDESVSIYKGAKVAGSKVVAEIIGIGFSKIKVKITYNNKTTIHEFRRGDGVLLENYDHSHGRNEFAYIDQKELSVRLEEN